MDQAAIYDQVSKHYSAASKTNDPAYGQSVAEAFGYSTQDLAGVPEDANLGLSCGNPLALASLKEGEVVIDFGSGAGFDVFQASPKVGPTGMVIGVDMNTDMLDRANKIKASLGTSATNTSFVQSRITSTPLPASIADVIISNCVINLVPHEEKQQVFNEMYRLLKPGGRVAVSDILARRTLPEQLRADMALYVGCIAGASLISEYEAFFCNAGFDQFDIRDAGADLNVYRQAETSNTSGCCAPSKPSCCVDCSSGDTSTANPATAVKKSEGSPNGNEVGSKGSEYNLNDWAGSYKIFAVKNI